jgi:hypothetical protein
VRDSSGGVYRLLVQDAVLLHVVDRAVVAEVDIHETLGDARLALEAEDGLTVLDCELVEDVAHRSDPLDGLDDVDLEVVFVVAGNELVTGDLVLRTIALAVDAGTHEQFGDSGERGLGSHDAQFFGRCDCLLTA